MVSPNPIQDQRYYDPSGHLLSLPQTVIKVHIKCSRFWSHLFDSCSEKDWFRLGKIVVDDAVFCITGLNMSRFLRDDSHLRIRKPVISLTISANRAPRRLGLPLKSEHHFLSEWLSLELRSNLFLNLYIILPGLVDSHSDIEDRAPSWISFLACKGCITYTYRHQKNESGWHLNPWSLGLNIFYQSFRSPLIPSYSMIANKRAEQVF